LINQRCCDQRAPSHNVPAAVDACSQNGCPFKHQQHSNVELPPDNDSSETKFPQASTRMRAVAWSGLTGVARSASSQVDERTLGGIHARINMAARSLTAQPTDFTRSAFVMIRCVDHGLTGA
jgi:hypothetical protein